MLGNNTNFKLNEDFKKNVLKLGYSNLIEKGFRTEKSKLKQILNLLKGIIPSDDDQVIKLYFYNDSEIDWQ